MTLANNRSGAACAALALGCSRLGSALTPLNRKQCVALIDEAFSLGVRHFDTASIYGQGDSERYIGEALAARRSQVYIASKAGQRLTSKQALVSVFKRPIRWMASQRQGVRVHVAEQRQRGVPRCFEPDYIERSLQESLRRLRTDHLDIFYLHSPDVSVLDDEPLMERIGKMREQGLFRMFGVSCDDDAVAWRASSHPLVEVVQFALEDRSVARSLLDALSRQGKQAIVRGLMQPGASGLISGDGLVERFLETMSLPAVCGVIVGTTKIQHLRHNVAAFNHAQQNP